MNIYKVSQTENTGYDTFDSFICYAATTHQASHMLPENEYTKWGSEWCKSADQVTVELLGNNKLVTEASVILASFNAG